jgi:hypothetical protein
MRIFPCVCAMLALTAAARATETVVVQGTAPKSGPDLCLKVAEAKVKQWNEARIRRERTDAFADGTTRTSEMVVTEDALYLHYRGIWWSGQTLRAQRRADSAGAVAGRMGLSSCSVDRGVAAEPGPVTVYTYSQGQGMIGALWVSDATGLPLREEIDQPAGAPAKPGKVSLRYAYGADVHVPNGAQLAEFQRRKLSQDWLVDLQLGRPTH